MASFIAMSRLPMSRVFSTAIRVLDSASPAPASRPARDRNSAEARRLCPHMGREKIGCTGIEPFGSPICATLICPPTSTISGLAAKKAGDHRTRSARLPGVIDPIWALTPCAMAGLIVYFAI